MAKALPRILLDDKKKKGENYILHFTKQESTPPLLAQTEKTTTVHNWNTKGPEKQNREREKICVPYCRLAPSLLGAIAM
jgi:hypothetical protein